MADFRSMFASCAPNSCKAYGGCEMEREQDTVKVQMPLPDDVKLFEEGPAVRLPTLELAEGRQERDEVGRLLDQACWQIAEENDLHHREEEVRQAEEDALWKRAKERAAQKIAERRRQELEEREELEVEPAQQREELERRKRQEEAALEASKQAAACMDRFLKELKVCGVNESVRKGVTSSYALIVAAEQGDEALVGILLKAGADPSLRNSWGRTARQAAERRAGRSPPHAAVAEKLRQAEERRQAHGAADRRRRFSPPPGMGG